MKKLSSASAQMPMLLPSTYLWEKVNELRVKGIPNGLRLGINSLDDICRLDRSRVATITGIPGSGKSEFVDFVTTTLNRNYGMKTLFFSPENQPIEWHLNKLIQQFSGVKAPDMSQEQLRDAVWYISNNFYFFNYERVTKLDDIMAIAKQAVKEKGVSVVVLDSYNKIESNKEANELETDFISKILDYLCRFAIEMNVLVILVAHPRKMESTRNGNYSVPNAYDINGSANFFNKSDYVIVVHREDRNDDDTLIKVDKVKFSCLGKGGSCHLRHDEESGNYYDEPVEEVDGVEIPGFDVEVDTRPEPFAFPKLPAAKEPLDVEVSKYNGATDNVGTIVNLRDFLFADTYKDVAERIRGGKTAEERHAIKNDVKNTIPCITVAGTFSQRDGKHLLSYSGLMSIDIDYADNASIMAKVPEILKRLGYVTYFSKSISGDGYFAICRIDYPEKFKEHFLALQEEFAGYGITIDKSCKDITRLRFASYDDNAYYNPNAHSYHLLIEDAPLKVKKETKLLPQRATSLSGKTGEEKVAKAIAEIRRRGLSIPDDYDTWFKLGMSLSTLGDKGRMLFHEISSISDKYNEQECNAQYDAIVEHYDGNNEFSIGTAISVLNAVLSNNNIKN